jgi:hypothetical protein
VESPHDTIYGDRCARSHKRKVEEPVDFVSFSICRLLFVQRPFKPIALIANIDLKRKYWLLGRFLALSFCSQPAAAAPREHLFAQETNGTSMLSAGHTGHLFGRD